MIRLANLVAIASLLALVALCLAWELWLAPLRPGGSWLALKALPLLAPLFGLLRGRRYTHQWATLLIQACAALARRGERVIYISGEEAVDQVRLRAGRLGLADATVDLASATQVEDILATLKTGKPLIAALSHDAVYPLGAAVDLNFDPAKAHLFPKED